MTSKTKTRLKIAGATITAIFSLISAFTGTMAWFANQNTVSANGMQVSVVSGVGCSLQQLSLVKFKYPRKTYGQFTFTDYLDVSNGAVKKYSYNEDNSSFGEQVGNNWIEEEFMNVFDPVDSELNNTKLIDMNCNVIYEVELSSGTSNLLMDLEAVKDPDATLPANDSNAIFLSGCVDFDYYLESDLLIDSSFSTSAEYSTGDLVLYNGYYYQRKQTNAPTADNAWTVSNWNLVNQFSASETYSGNVAVVYDGLLYNYNDNESSTGSWDETKWAVVDTYSNNSQYSKGQFVFHNGLLFTCDDAITTTENWTIAHWKTIASKYGYCPSHLTLSELENYGSNQEQHNLAMIYFKISYLSSLETTHPHLYDSANDDPVSLNTKTNKEVSFSNQGKLKVYININYAPSKLKQYVKDLYSTSDSDDENDDSFNHIRAVCDFNVNFKLSEIGNGGN